jgi:hypothetical protein
MNSVRNADVITALRQRSQQEDHLAHQAALCIEYLDGLVESLLPKTSADWPSLVTFSENTASNHTQRSQYRRGKLPSVRSLIRWAKAHGLRFVVDADGMRCERV